ncbi:hypothetical protein GH714_038519 [Hevea brasiliensis]|uniref:Mechanosensitive ion channel MscS domain-containing protein n=1 Tax=Hevea brasiliensis TaxID=3981 RepID=A0A6A6KE40_HEVBR|nr:hypothetical protein GH714_038519 [Hevea brasiliensis]
MAGETDDFSIQISDAAENAVILLNSQIGSSLPQSTEPQNLGDRDPSFSTSSKPPLNNLIQRKSQTSSPSSKPLELRRQQMIRSQLPRERSCLYHQDPTRRRKPRKKIDCLPDHKCLMSLIWKLWLDERVLYFAHGVKKSVLFFIWLALVTLAWGLLFNHGIRERLLEVSQVDIYKDHDSLNNTLQHSKTAIDELNMIASVIVLIVVAVVWLLVMEVLSTKLLLFMSSQLLLVVFMFGNTVKNVFEAVIFVFVVHAFDVGDRCVIDGMVVDEMNILTTTFLRYDGEKIYYPNSILALKPISNLYRSPPMSECVEFAISLRTSMEIINDLQDNIKRYLESNPRRWRAEHSLQFKEIEDVNKMKVALFVNHTINFHYFAKRAKRRSELVLQMKQIFEELKIEYNLLPQQVNLSYTASAPSAPPIPVRRS